MLVTGREQEEHIHRCHWEDVGPVPEEPFIQYVMGKMAEYGDKAALVDGTSGKSLSYNETVKLVQQLSNGWRAAGLRAGDVVCMVTPNCIMAPPVLLAAAARAAPVTLANPLYTPDELRYHITNSQSKWLVIHPACLQSVKAATKDLEDIKGIYVLGDDAEDGMKPVSSLQENSTEDWTPEGVSGDEAVILPYSSGTTGRPKGVLLSSKNLMALLSTIGRKEYICISNEDIMLGILPFFHVFGIGLCLGSLSHGATMVTLPRFIPDIFLNSIQANKVTIVPLVPPLAIFLAKHELVDKYDMSSVNNIVCGAAALSGDIQELLSNRLSGVWVRQGFGMTETTLACFVSEAQYRGAIGRVTPHCEAKVVDIETGDSLGPNENGELCIRGPLTTKGYLNSKEATSELIDANGWLHTGDVGYYDEEGIFYIVDRIKELIKYKGFQVAPAELEGLLVTHESVADAVVVGVKDEEAGELPRAYLVPKPGCTLEPEEVVAWVQDRVAPHKRLRAGVQLIDAVPRSAAGKILRRKVKELS